VLTPDWEMSMRTGTTARRRRWPWAKRAAAIGTIAVYGAAGEGALTASDNTPPVAAGTLEAAPARRFEIQPGTFADVMAGFETATGLRIEIPWESLRKTGLPGITGLYTPEDALKKLLEGTGIEFRFVGPRNVRLEIPGPSETVNVSDIAPVLASAKYTEPLVDTPQTILVIPRSLMEEQGATTLRDVLRNVPGLTIAAGEGGTPAGDNLTLRGFSARNDLFLDGARDLSPQARDPFNTEQVEVTKGPTSAVAGRGSAGGTINMISKQPTLGRMLGGTVHLGSDGTRRLASDTNVPLGERTALRVNLLRHESGVAGRDVVENERWGAAPSLAFGLWRSTRLTLNFFKLKQHNISDYGIPWVPATNNVLAEYRDRPAPVPRNTFYGLRDRDREHLDSNTATIRFELDFSDSLTLRNQLRFGRSTRDSNATPPRFASNDSTVINREMRSWIAADRIWDNQTDLSARFSTRGIAHSLVAGANLSNENNIRKTRSAPVMPTTLLSPNPDDVYPSPITPGLYTGDVTGKTQSVYLFDTAKLSEHWEATGGLRWERFDARGVTTAPAAIARVDTMTSVRGALVYKPGRDASLYASYGTSLSPSLEGLSYGTANTAIEPERTYTFETGGKWNMLGERLMLTGAWFHVEKTNARTPGLLPDDPPQVLQGTQRVQGVEMGATGALTRRWKLYGAYTFMANEIVKSNTAAEVGKRIQNAPANSASIWTTCQFWKLTLGIGPRVVGERFGNNTNTRKVDSYWTVESLVSYQLNRHIDLRLNLFNLNDAHYFDRLGGGHVVPGPARSVTVSTGIRF